MNMAGLADIADHILNSDEVTVCRVKDRFTESSGAGWTDLLLNFYMNDDENKHVCEVQLIHFKMLSQRTTQEGHEAYNIFRAASELLQLYQLAEQNNPQSLTSFKKAISQLVRRTIAVFPQHEGDVTHDVSSVTAEGLQHGTLTQSSSGQEKSQSLFTTNSRKKGRNPKVFPKMIISAVNDESGPNLFQDLRDWLVGMRLEQYADDFVESGFDCLDKVQKMSVKEVIQLLTFLNDSKDLKLHQVITLTQAIDQLQVTRR